MYTIGGFTHVDGGFDSDVIRRCSMEFMDAGSLDKFSGFPVPEPVLKRVTASMVRGLKFLKDELQTMHRGECRLSSADGTLRSDA